MKGWCKIPDLDHMTRTGILDQGDWLDALEEAEDKQAEDAKRERERDAPVK